MSSTSTTPYYRYYCLINTVSDFKKLSLFSKIVDSHDITVVSKIYKNPEDCVLTCANLVKAVMTEINEIGDNSYKILWDTAEPGELKNSSAKEVSVAKFYLVDKSYIGKNPAADLPTCFSASVVKLQSELKFELAEKSFSKKNHAN
jgi:hypothetical protein